MHIKGFYGIILINNLRGDILNRDDNFKILSHDEVMELNPEERLEHDRKAFAYSKEQLGMSGFALAVLPEECGLHTNHAVSAFCAKFVIDEIVDRNLQILKEQNPLAMMRLVEIALNNGKVSFGGIRILGEKLNLKSK